MSVTGRPYHEDVTNPNGNRDPCEVKWRKDGVRCPPAYASAPEQQEPGVAPDGAGHPGSCRDAPCADRPRALPSLLCVSYTRRQQMHRSSSVLLPSYFTSAFSSSNSGHSFLTHLVPSFCTPNAILIRVPTSVC